MRAGCHFTQPLEFTACHAVFGYLTCQNAQVLSNKQMKKPAKLFARGDPSVGYSIYVRALSKDAVEARWLHRFIDLATCDPSEPSALSCLQCLF